MAAKVCCIQNCKSCSTRTEDIGVTFHKFPRVVSLCDSWVKATRHDVTKTDTPAYVCSRHFCKSDFQCYKDSKYVLKSDSVPSIFHWETEMESEEIDMEATNENKEVNKSKEGDGENLDAIKKFIEDQEKEYTEQESKKEENAPVEAEKPNEVDGCKDFDERLAVASSMMDMILNESEERIAKKKNGNSSKQMSPKAGNSMSLSVGSKVEARDFEEDWYPAQITEVDYEEMEVLVHYENSTKKHDEWISVSSPRLRPLSAASLSSPKPAPPPTPQPPQETTVEVVPSASTAPEEPKQPEEKKLTFEVGERCLARWRDSRRFVATITKVLDDGHYEVVFDDGFAWKCTTSRLHKMKDQSKPTTPTVDVAYVSQPPTVQGAGPNSATPIPPTPAFHTHLFDPTRDYLGSKSERREKKRKLNIKEIFNIGQKKMKKQVTPSVTPKPPVARKQPRIIRKKPAPAKVTPKQEIPDAVASIIGTLESTEPVPSPKATEIKTEIKEEIKQETEVPLTTEEVDIVKDEPEEMKQELAKVVDDVDESKDSIQVVDPMNDACDTSDTGDSRPDSDLAHDGEMKLEKFEEVEDKQEVIDRIKEVIIKLEDNISKAEGSPKPEVKTETVEVKVKQEEKKVKKLKIKKQKKLRLLNEKKVKKQVEQVKSELELMKRKFDEMRRQMMTRTEELTTHELPESFLLPGEWCCKWVNGQPVGKVCELVEKEKSAGLPRRSVQVEDPRLPEGWTKHMVRRSLGSSAGKWDVVLVSPENRRFHTRTDMRHYMEAHPDVAARLKEYETVLMDFGVHLKLARRMGWVTSTPDGVTDAPVLSLPAGTLLTTSPIVKRQKLSLKRPQPKDKKKKKRFIKMPKYLVKTPIKPENSTPAETDPLALPAENAYEAPPLEDGYVWVGSLKVQIIDTLLRCPAEGCFKNFRNNTLLQMHIKHYHREMRKMLGLTPKVLDLASARSKVPVVEQPKTREAEFKTLKVKIPKLSKRMLEQTKQEIKEEIKPVADVKLEAGRLTPVKTEEPILKMQDSPKLRNALATKPAKRPRVLLPVRKPDPDETSQDDNSEPAVDIPMEVLDFETEISTHTVTKPHGYKEKKRVATLKPMSEDDEWLGVPSDVETRSSFPRSGSPDMTERKQAVSSESNEEQKDANMYMFTETGERIKIVHMKREEIINCHCGFREEDGLMVQCELCLCWQHALCHNIQKETEVPDKYTCSICLNPRRGRRSQRFLHDQDRLYEGLLPGARPCESLRRAHELAGNLHRVADALHALRVKYHVATKKNHPKLYLWAKDWENGELSLTQEKLNSDYSDLNIMISSIGKENLPLRSDDLRDVDIQTPPSEDHDRYSQREGSLLSGASLELPISASELERLASTVQEEVQRVMAPQPEAAIENGACRERLLRHIQRCQAVIDARLDSIEAQVAELESQDPSFEDDETADYFPRTKQTIQMLMRDLDTMEELGVIT